MSESTEYPKFVRNSAKGEDKFPEKAQEKLAKAIANLISKKEPESKIIGLEGAWGAGKSNVIRMIENQLKDTHHIYVHDVWSFQEDLQRRTFLESLTSDLYHRKKDGSEPFLKNADKWDDELKKLLAKKKETTIETIPVFSPGFLFVILLIVLWTVAGDFSGPIYLDGEIIHKRGWVAILGIIGYLYFSYKEGKPLLPKDVFYIYNKQDTSKVTNETIFESEPSPERFTQWITDLQIDFTDDKELVVVFDNMDRLPEEKIGQMWSLIHTFFREKDFRKIWVIVPYSREHIIKAFGKGDVETDHFIDKTFTIQYLVPPPIMSDWKAFFNQIYLDAFGNTEAEERTSVITIFDRLNSSITPRKILIFINETVALKKLWIKEIPLRYIALFVLTKRKILENPVEQILNKSFIEKCESVFSDDDKLQDCISALVYNIPIVSATQVILKRELKMVLLNKANNPEKIDAFAKQPFFLDMLESIIHEDRETDGFEINLNLISPEVYKGLDNDRMISIWNLLGINHKQMPVTIQQFTEIDKILLLKIAANRKQKFVDKLLDDLGKVDEGNFSGENYFKIITDIEDFIDKKGLKDIKVNAPLLLSAKKPEVFLDYLKASGEEYTEYGLHTNNEQLNDFLISKIPGELNNLVAAKYLRGNESYNLNKFITRLKEMVTKDEANIYNVAPLFDLLKNFSNELPIDITLSVAKLKELLNSTDLSHSFLPHLVAMRIKLDEELVNENTPTYNVVELTDEKLTDDVSKCIQDYVDLGTLIQISLRNPKPLIVNVTRKIITSGDDSNCALTIGDVLQQLELACQTFKVTPEDFLTFLEGWSKFAIEDISEKNIFTTIKTPAEFHLLLRVNNKLTSHLIRCMSDYVRNITEEEWKTCLRDFSSYQYNVLNILLENKKLETFPNNAVKAYSDLLIEIAKGSFAIPPDQENWNRFYEMTDKSNLSAVIKNIRDHYVNGQPITPEQYKFFSSMWEEMKILKGKEGDFCRTVLQSVINNDSILNSVILAKQEFYASIINAAKEDAFPLKGSIKEKLNHNPENPALKEFAEKLGIKSKVSEIKTEEKEGDSKT